LYQFVGHVLTSDSQCTEWKMSIKFSVGVWDAVTFLTDTMLKHTVILYIVYENDHKVWITAY